MNEISDIEGNLRHPPLQARSRERLYKVLDAADELLASDGQAAFTTTNIAHVAGIPVGSVYRYFPDKGAIVEALALRYWSDFEDLVAGVAEADTHEPLERPVHAILETLAAGFRARPGFRALWYGGLRSEQVREVTRGTRSAIARSVEQIFANHWPAAPAEVRIGAARMVVLTGDGLLREAFRIDPQGDPGLLAESEAMITAYIDLRLA